MLLNWLKMCSGVAEDAKFTFSNIQATLQSWIRAYGSPVFALIQTSRFTAIVEKIMLFCYSRTARRHYTKELRSSVNTRANTLAEKRTNWRMLLVDRSIFACGQ